jgi:hypothetical protein
MPLEAILLGLGTGSYCVMTCAPLVLPFLFADSGAPGRNAALVGLFMGGRLAGYLAVGAVLGFSGYVVKKYVDPGLENILSLIAFGIAGAVLLLQGLGYTGKFKRACSFFGSRAAKRNAFLLGAVSGLSLCPPFLAAAARVLSQAARGSLPGTLSGMAYFLLFFLGTSVFFLPLFGIPLLTRWKDALASVARICLLLMGGYFLAIQCLLELLKMGVRHA